MPPVIDHKELARKSEDIFAVYNPDEVDFPVRWGELMFTVPGCNRDTGDGKGTRHLPRYLAFRYLRKKADAIVGRDMIKATKEENARREKNKQSKMNYHTEQRDFQASFMVNNQHRRKELMASLLKGLVQEHGRDIVAESIPAQARDLRSEDERLFDELTGFSMPMTEASTTEESAIPEEVLAQAFEDDEPDTV